MKAGGHGILKNTAVVAALTALSRLLGLVREMLQSRFIGAGVEQSAFALAFAIPNMARKLFGEGAMTAAFVPVFKGCVETEAREKAVRLARAVMTMIMLMLVAVVAIAFLGLDVIVACRRELELSGRALLTIRLVKTMLPYMIFICGAAFGMAVLNAMGRFKAAGFMPCLLNLFWIGVLGWIAFHRELSIEQRIHRVAIAILVAGAAQMAYMTWRMRCAGVSPGITFRGWGDSKVRLVWRNTAVAAVGAGAVQINYMLDTALAQIAAPWAAGVIGYAERLMDLPLGVIGVAFGTVLLPTFAGLFAKGDVPAAREAFVSSARNMLFVMLPAAVGLGILAPNVTAAIYQGGEFDVVATTRVSRAVSCYAFGLAFFGLQKSLVPWFQAQNDMKTPLKVSVCTVCVNAVLNVLAVFGLPVEWRHVGLAGSTVFCAVLSCVLLSVFAHRKNGALGWCALLPMVVRIFAACALMGGVLLLVRPWLANAACVVVPSNRAPVVALAALVAIGAVVYFAASAVLMPYALRQALRRVRRK